MVVNREGIEARLEELDEILGELSRYRDVSADEIRGLAGFRNILVEATVTRGRQMESGVTL